MKRNNILQTEWASCQGITMVIDSKEKDHSALLDCRKGKVKTQPERVGLLTLSLSSRQVRKRAFSYGPAAGVCLAAWMVFGGSCGLIMTIEGTIRRFISPLLSRERVGGAAGRTQGEDEGLEEGGGTAPCEGTGAGLVIQETRLFPQSALVGTI